MHLQRQWNRELVHVYQLCDIKMFHPTRSLPVPGLSQNVP